MLYSHIGIGDRLKINLKGRLDSVEYSSQVESIIGKNRLLVYAPIKYGEIVKLSDKATYSVLFFTNKGILAFDSNIIEYTLREGFHIMTIELVSAGTRVQRRGFFRFSCDLGFNFFILDEKAKGGSKEDTLFSGRIKDISAGGLRFISNEDINESKFLKCLLDFDKEILICIANIIEKHRINESSYKYQYRVKFVGILPEGQEKIVQFIFNEQRKLLQRVDAR